jgi:hypothetical protein
MLLQALADFAYRELCSRQIQLRLSGSQKFSAPARFFSNVDADKAYALREAGDPAALSAMTSSILRWPFGYLKRYKTWLHMLLTRLKLLRPQLPL